MQNYILGKVYTDNLKILDTELNVAENFDIVKREIVLAEKNSVMYFIDGFIKDDIMEKIIEYFMEIGVIDLNNFSNTFVPYVEVENTDSVDKIVLSVMSGAIAFMIDGMEGAIIIDARTYPTRSMQEPENDKVLRGARDGFVETMIFNTALIRRRIRDPNLTMTIKSVGKSSRTDVIICYMKNKADLGFVKMLEDKIDAIEVQALNMCQESLAESLIKSRWYNPFPKIRYTERPDSAAASVLEGSVIIICDNSPVVMLLPTSIFDFLQETDDYYFPPLTGTYLKLLRFSIFFITIFLTPVWYLLIQNPSFIPYWLDFIKIGKQGAIPILLQLFIIEFAIDGLKLASLNTPSMLNNSLSVVGGLILGDFAVKVGWFIPEVILYMAFVSIANFTQPSYELGYAFKFMRLILISLTALFNIWGFISGFILIIILIASNKTVNGKRSYLYPLIPFNARALIRLFTRQKLK